MSCATTAPTTDRDSAGKARSDGKTNSATIAVSLLALWLSGTVLAAQQSATPAQTSESPQSAQPVETQAQSDKNALEMSTEETSTTFKVKVNLVEVRVVVRDAQGHAVGNLKQDDFQLLDNGKPQVISRFAVEQAGTKPAVHQDTAPETPAQNGASLTLPKRYIAYLFDDIHLQVGDLAQVRNAADRHFQTLLPTDRAAIFTTSGQTQLDFTDDRGKLQETLNRIRPSSIASTGTTECPNMTYYMADQIQNKHDEEASRVAAQDALDCAFRSDGTMMRQATQMAQEAAQRQLNLGNHETQLSLAALKDVVRRVAAMPGQRSILIVSPGFYNPAQLQDQTEVADRALHSYVTINALDARGVYTVMLDASTDRAPTPTIAPQMMALLRAEAMADADVLSDLAYSTGGTFF